MRQSLHYIRGRFEKQQPVCEVSVLEVLVHQSKLLRRTSRCLFGFMHVAVLVVSSACGDSSTPPPKAAQIANVPELVATAVEDAKKTGRSRASISSSEDPGADTLDHVLASSSVVVLKPSKVHAELVVTTRFVTWSSFQIVQEIGRQELVEGACEQPPDGLSLGPHEVALGMLGGRMNVAGMPFEWHSPTYDLPLEPSSSYLAVVIRCTNKAIRLRSFLGFIALDESGKLMEAASGEDSGFWTELRSLRTLSNVEQQVLKIQKGVGL